MDLENILVWARFCIHIATFLFIFCYRPKGARQRWGVSMLAMGLAGQLNRIRCIHNLRRY